ncbi:Ephexin-1 [Nymphon striatum]|nr:Ephexin-1 [Nymphon striatum]
MMMTTQALVVGSQQSLSSSSYYYENMYNPRYYKSFHGVTGSSSSSDNTTSKCKLNSGLFHQKNDNHASSVNSCQPNSLTTAGLLKESKRSSSSPCLDDIAGEKTEEAKAYCSHTSITLLKKSPNKNDGYHASPYAISRRPQVAKTLPGMYETTGNTDSLNSSTKTISSKFSSYQSTSKDKVAAKYKNDKLQQQGVGTSTSVLSKKHLNLKSVKNSSVRHDFELPGRSSSVGEVGSSKVTKSTKINTVANLKNKFDKISKNACHEELTISSKNELSNQRANDSSGKKNTNKFTHNDMKSSVNKPNCAKVLKSSTLPDCSVLKKYQTNTKNEKSSDTQSGDKKVSCVKLAVRNFERSISDSTNENPKKFNTDNHKPNILMKDKNDHIKATPKLSQKVSSVPASRVTPFESISKAKFHLASQNKISTKATEAIRPSPKYELTTQSKPDRRKKINEISETKENHNSADKLIIQSNLPKKNASALHDRIILSNEVKLGNINTIDKISTENSISREKLITDSTKTDQNTIECQVDKTHNEIQIERQVKIIQNAGPDEQKLKKILIKNKKLDLARAKLGKPPEPPKNFNSDKIPLPQPRKVWTDKIQHTYLNNFNINVSNRIEHNAEVSPPLPLKLVNPRRFNPEPSKNLISLHSTKTNEKKSKSLPNSSFLWNYKESFASSNETLDTVGSIESPDQNRTDSGDYFEDSYVLEENILEYASTSVDDEPIYMEADFHETKKMPDNNGIYAYRDVTNLRDHCKDSGESDEGWVDDSESEHNHTDSVKEPTRSKCRKKQSTKKSNPKRLSWSRSYQRLNKNSESPKDEYQDVHDWDMNDVASVSSYTDSVDHQYEALYDIINQSSIVTDVVNLDNSVDAIPQLPERDHSPFPKIKNKTVSKDSGIGEYKFNTMDGCLNDEVNGDSAELTKEGGDKSHKIKRNWSLTKSDIRLELISRWNRMKPKKTSRSAAEIVYVQNESKFVDNEKQNLEIKLIPNKTSKLTYSSPLISPNSPTQETAQFYIKGSDLEAEVMPPERPKSESFTLDCSRNNPHPRRVSLKSISRPKVPPPKPPIESMFYDVIWRNSDTSGIDVDNPCILKSSSESCVPVNQSKYFDLIFIILGNFIIFSSKFFSRIPISSDADMDKNVSQVTSLNKDRLKKPDNLNLNSTKGARKLSADNLVVELNLSSTINEASKSPIREEPLYQFYQEHMKQRTSQWNNMSDGSGSEADYSCHYEKIGIDKIENGITKRDVSVNRQISAMEIVKSEVKMQTLWCDIPEVKTRGILDKLTAQERKLQEAIFEVMTSEASYLKSLDVLVNHFMSCPEFVSEFSTECVLTRHDKHILFSDVLPVYEVSKRLLADFEKHWQEDIRLPKICDILYEHASKYFNVYVKYCSNQLYQDRQFKNLKDTKPEFVEVIKKLESSPVCQSLSFHSFLMLPMQRITRLPLLVDAIYHRLEAQTYEFESARKTLTCLNTIVAECNEGARKMERMEEMLLISQLINFKDCKGIPLISPNRWIVKKGELTKLTFNEGSTKIPFSKTAKCTKMQVYLFLFTDLLIITKQKGDGSYAVIDYCLRNMVQVSPIDGENIQKLSSRPPDGSKNLFQCIMLQNHESKTVELVFSCNLESERTRWMEAVTPPTSENPDEKIYEEWALEGRLEGKRSRGRQRTKFLDIMGNSFEASGVTITVPEMLHCAYDRDAWKGMVGQVFIVSILFPQIDCPQVQVLHFYQAQQPDELTLEESDVVNVFRKMADGWFQGERIRDGIQGWFPANHTEEIVSSHVRARYLRQRYRLLQLSHSYLLKNQRSRSK